MHWQRLLLGMCFAGTGCLERRRGSNPSFMIHTEKMHSRGIKDALVRLTVLLWIQNQGPGTMNHNWTPRSSVVNFGMWTCTRTDPAWLFMHFDDEENSERTKIGGRERETPRKTSIVTYFRTSSIDGDTSTMSTMAKDENKTVRENIDLVATFDKPWSVSCHNAFYLTRCSFYSWTGRLYRTVCMYSNKAALPLWWRYFTHPK